jgi:hypothetical protein
MVRPADVDGPLRMGDLVAIPLPAHRIPVRPLHRGRARRIDVPPRLDGIRPSPLEQTALSRGDLPVSARRHGSLRLPGGQCPRDRCLWSCDGGSIDAERDGQRASHADGAVQWGGRLCCLGVLSRHLAAKRSSQRAAEFHSGGVASASFSRANSPHPLPPKSGSPSELVRGEDRNWGMKGSPQERSRTVPADGRTDSYFECPEDPGRTLPRKGLIKLS